MKKHTSKIAIVLFAMLLVLLSACTDSNGSRNTAREAADNAQNQQERINESVERIQQAQQIPAFDWSQEYQTIIDSETARATGAPSTTEFTYIGSERSHWCPSVGAPVPSTYQLSNSQQYVDLRSDDTRQRFPIDQAEPTGAIIGESSATWTICLSDEGEKFAVYWEGPVNSVIGTMQFPEEERLLPSELTFEVTENPEG